MSAAARYQTATMARTTVTMGSADFIVPHLPSYPSSPKGATSLVKRGRGYPS